MKCEAIAVRTGERCKNEAVGDTGACLNEAHQRQVLKSKAARGEPLSWTDVDAIAAASVAAPLDRELTDEEIAPTWDAARAPATAEPSTGSAAELERLLAELPAAGDRAAEEIAETAAAGMRNVEELERAARRVLTDVDELLDDESDPASIDAAAAARADEDAARVQLRRDVTAYAGKWNPERVKFYLRVLINPRFVKDGKEPLTDDEIQEGAEIGAQILNDLFGARPDNPYAAAAAWCATIAATRYLEEILGWVGGIVRRRRGAPAAAPVAPELDAPLDDFAAAPAAASGLTMDAGFGVARG